jgi:hypothetical protein
VTGGSVAPQLLQRLEPPFGGRAAGVADRREELPSELTKRGGGPVAADDISTRDNRKTAQALG